MSTGSMQNFDQFKEVYRSLETIFTQSRSTIGIQKQIYVEFITIFAKFTKQLTSLSQRINEQILNNHSDEATVNTYQFLSNCLLRMAECSRKVATKGKNQVLDPLEMFGKNYDHLCQDMLSKFSGCLVLLSKSDSNLTKHRESYLLSAEKLQKFKETQNRIFSKIEKGDLSQLDKFNSSISKLNENINECEKNYKSGVDRINKEWDVTKSHLSSLSISMQYNQQSRVSFTRRSVQSSIKLLEEFNNAFDSSCTQKLQDSNNRMLGSEPKDNSVNKRLLSKIGFLTSTVVEEEFVSYDEIGRRRKMTLFEEESIALNQIFSKVGDHGKAIIREIVRSWFADLGRKNDSNGNQTSVSSQGNSPTKQQNQYQSPISNTLVDKSKSMTNLKLKRQIRKESAQHNLKLNLPDSKSSNTKLERSQSTNEISLHSLNQRKATSIQLQINSVKQKILIFKPYSFYFVEILHQSIAEMTSFYCKVDEQDFLLILKFLTTISENMRKASEVSIQLLFKMILISQRITKKRVNPQGVIGKPIELLCYQYGKSCQCLRDSKILKRLLQYLEKRKSLKKKGLEPEKNIVVGLAKGLFSAMTRKKEPTLPPLSEDEKFNCLQQLTHIMANLSLPNQISLPLIKKEVQNNQSYDYLKEIILAKRDQEEKHRLAYIREVKQKRDEEMKRILDGKGQAVYCLVLTAKIGFLSKEDISLRLVTRSLMKIHVQIIHNLDLPITKKWPLLIPYDRHLDYNQMKLQVAENNVPSSIEEIITLDVNRSLHLHGDYFNPTLLHSLLSTYAYYHKQIEYCQGMNYIAGYIYIKTLAEQPAYRIFEYVMELRFKQLFLQEFKQLKLKMYQFERLLTIFHPQLFQHFKRQGISPECYIVSWMITMFSSTYQYTMHSHVVDVLWERFIVYGWREFHRFVLWLFSLYKEDLLDMNYDKVLRFMGELSKSEMFMASEEEFQREFGIDVRAEMGKYEITDDVLEGFLQQYQLP